MEDDNKKEENNEVTEDVKNDGISGPQERSFDNQYQLIRKSPKRKFTRNEQYDRRPSRSRSRSRSKPSWRKQWRSANAFLNFMQDFRQDNNKVKSRDLFRLGGQKWRQMSSTEKMPYVEAAKLAQQQTQDNKTEQQTTTKPIDGDVPKKLDNEQRKEEEREKRKKRKRSRSKTDDSYGESDSATSRTGASTTSEDISDMSS